MNTHRYRALLAAGLLWFCGLAFAGADGSQVQLPEGVDLAIVVFEDLQCPDCARAHPELLKASEALKVPVVIHDFPITRHVWAFPAAILARWFTAQSPALGVEFRSFIFEHQHDIRPDNLRQYGEQFAAQHQLALPADVDPDGKLQALVQADFDLGVKIKLGYVPLIFVIARDGEASRAVEVTDLARLGEAIDQMRATTPR
jgi:protein-disulfide isomerase